MWDLPGSEVEPVSPTLAGCILYTDGFSTTEPPRKSQPYSFNIDNMLIWLYVRRWGAGDGAYGSDQISPNLPLGSTPGPWSSPEAPIEPEGPWVLGPLSHPRPSQAQAGQDFILGQQMHRDPAPNSYEGFSERKLYLSYFGIYVCVPHLSYLFIRGTLGCFHILTITNGAAMNIGVFSLSLDVYLKVELLDYMVVLF